jgi:ectoine hydroxylase-related dioxygenase (phytanoyl-CoA dioxygenase family)
VDPATRDNGCLHLIEGSHHCGRLDHVIVGERVGADRERVEELLKRMPQVAIEMAPGDVLFFHCNLLHCSGRNPSDQPRWALISVYNAARNDPYCDSRHARYAPLAKVPDSAIKEVGQQRFATSVQ